MDGEKQPGSDGLHSSTLCREGNNQNNELYIFTENISGLTVNFLFFGIWEPSVASELIWIIWVWMGIITPRISEHICVNLWRQETDLYFRLAHFLRHSSISIVTISVTKIARLVSPARVLWFAPLVLCIFCQLYLKSSCVKTRHVPFWFQFVRLPLEYLSYFKSLHFTGWWQPRTQYRNQWDFKPHG